MAQAKQKIRLTTVVGICCGVLFCGLLAVRLGLLEDDHPAPLPITRKTPATYTWHEIFQESEKIGYSHRRVIPRDGGYRISETTFMRLNTMGMVQDINLVTKGVLAADMSLSEFAFELKSSRFNFKASGKVGTNEIELNVNGQPSTMPVKTPLYLTAGIFDAVAAVDIKIGETRSFNIFDPSSMSQRPIKVTFAGMEKVKILDEEISTRRLETDFMGARHTAWVTLTGEIVQETGPLGITLKKSDARRAFRNIAAHTRDLTRLVAVDAGRKLEDTENIKTIAYQFEGLPRLPDIDGDRQRLDQDLLFVSREGSATPDRATDLDPRSFLGPSPFVQADHPDIVSLARTLVPENAPGREKVLRIKDWLYTEIEKRPVISVPNALETLKNKMGDCNEHAVLFAALARASGVPTIIEAGLVYLNGRFYYHAWNAVYLDQWVTVDALMDQFPADVTHIRLTRGGPGSQLDLMGVIGNINLKIVDIQYD
jgi:hypothetical protein